jgi:hypothetical protein
MSMRTSLLGALALLLSINISWAQGGFAQGDHYSLILYRGQVTVWCSNGSASSRAFYSCAEERAHPGAFAHFVTSENVDADEVRITARHENGAVQTRTRNFNARTNESRSFNLLVRTLFQRPLLGLGDNRLSYELTKRGVVVALGEFDVRVERDPVARQCRAITLTTTDMNACQNHTVACDQYFRTVGPCR